jgi:cyclophilin family peptidyl-prolyl cis-trans isomerase
MWDRTEAGPIRRSDRERRATSTGTGRGRVAPRVEALEGRALLAASIAPIATVLSGAGVGYQLPINGSGSANAQTFSVNSSNPDVKATVARGQFMTVNVTHASSGASDPAFTGTLVYQLFQDLTPDTVAHISGLVTDGFYTGKNFHRIANGFPTATTYIVQGGSVSGTGTGNPTEPGFPFPDEFNPQLVFNGTEQLAMANSGNDTNSSQFFTTTGSPRSLDFDYTIFGQLVSGANVIQQMTQVALTADASGSVTKPVSPILITSASLSNANPNGVIHIDTTGATAGEASNVTVMATDPTTGTTAAQTFTVDVVPNDPANGERPFLNPLPAIPTLGAGQSAVFQATATDVTPGAQLTYVVKGGVNPAGTAFTDLTNATGTVDSNGLVTVTPTSPTFTGPITVLVGVRDQTNRVVNGTLESPGNYDTQTITLNYQNGAFVNLTPVASTFAQTVAANQSSSLALTGVTANPQSPTQTINGFTLVSQPTHGTLTNFNPVTGSATYTPNANFSGNDTFQYTVTDSGAPTPNLTSAATTVTLTVSSGAVRQIDDVLFITAPSGGPKQKNTILVNQVNGVILTSINGNLDSFRPTASGLSRIVIYGAKASDTVNVSDVVDVPTTIDGGRGGINYLKAGAAASRMHGWYGQNVLQGGPSDDALIGRTGQVKFVRSGGTDTLFAGQPSTIPSLYGSRGTNRHRTRPNRAQFTKSEAPTGTFYKFVGTGNAVVAIPTPKSMPFKARGSAGGHHVPSQSGTLP